MMVAAPSLWRKENKTWPPVISRVFLNLRQTHFAVLDFMRNLRLQKLRRMQQKTSLLSVGVLQISLGYLLTHRALDTAKVDTTLRCTKFQV